MKKSQQDATCGLSNRVVDDKTTKHTSRQAQDDRRSFAQDLSVDRFFDTDREQTFATLGRVSTAPLDSFPWVLAPEKRNQIRKLVQDQASRNGQSQSFEPEFGIEPSDILAFAAEGARTLPDNLKEANRLWWKMRESAPAWQVEDTREQASKLERFLDRRSKRIAEGIVDELGFGKDESHLLFKTERFSRRTVYTRDYAALPKQLCALFDMVPRLVFTPRTTEQLCRFMAYAHAKGTKVTARGRGTWALGGALLTKGGVVLELASFAKKIRVDADNKQVTVSASVDFQEAEEALNREGLTLKARPSNKYGVIAGFLSVGEPLKGGLGLNAFAFGHIRNSIESIRVVTSKGEERLVEKDSADFPLYLGTNGRHGIITEITLEAISRSPKQYTTAVQFVDRASAFEFLRTFQEDLKAGRSNVRPVHVEFYSKFYLGENRKLKPAKDQPITVNLISPESIRRNSAPKDTVLFVFHDQVDWQNFTSYIDTQQTAKLVGQSESDELWDERFSPMKLRKKGDLLTAEVILPLARVEAYLAEMTALAAKLGVQLLPVAYILSSGEALVLPQFITDRRRMGQYFRHFSLVPILAWRATAQFEGRPYGFGLWFSGLARRALGSRTFRKLKTAKKRLDPKGILNPGKLGEIRSRLGNVLGYLFLHERAISLLEHVVRLQTYLAGVGKFQEFFSTTTEPYVIENGDALHRCIKCSACMICPLAQIWEKSGDPKLVKDAIYITPRFKMEYMQQHIYDGKKLSQEDVDRFVLCFRCGVAERETVCPISDMLLEVEKNGSTPCQKKLPTYDDFEARLRKEGYDVDGAISRYMDILKTHPGVAFAMKEVLGNYRVPKTGDLTVLQPKTDFAIYKVDVDQDRCINCGKCGDEHTTSQRGFWDPRNPRNMVSLDDLLKDLDGKLPKTWFNDAGGPIPLAVKNQGRSNGEHVYFPKTAPLDAGHHHCNGCMYCVIECPVDAIRVNINDYYIALAGTDFSREDIRRVNEESRTGGVPTSGTGSTGLFGGKGFDRYMFDFSVIVRPTRDGIREEIDIGVNLGRKPLFHLFESAKDGSLPRLKTHFPTLDLPVPVLLDLPVVQGRKQSRDLVQIFLRTARDEGTLTFLSLFQFIENFEQVAQFTQSIVLRLLPEEVSTVKAWFNNKGFDARVLQAIREIPAFEIVRELSVSARNADRSEAELCDTVGAKIISNLLVCPPGSAPSEVAIAVEALAQSGAQIIHLKTQFNPKKGYYESADVLPECYDRLLAKSLHTQVSIISNGVKSPADLGISMMLGASAVVADRVALVALNHELCALETKGETLPEIEVSVGVSKLANLFKSWKKQLSEVLGAFGIRDIRRTVGERGRLIDLRDREKKMRAIVEDRKLLQIARKVNDEKVAEDGHLAREASWRYSQLGKLLKPVTPPNVNLLGERGESLESMLSARGDRRWNAGMLKATWQMASGQVPSHKVAQTGSDFGPGSFDLMKFSPVKFGGKRSSLEAAVEEVEKRIQTGDHATLHALDSISISAGVINKHRRPDSAPAVNHFPIDAADMSLGSIGWKLTLARYLAGTVLRRYTGTGEGGYPLEKYERLQRFFPQLSGDEVQWLGKEMERWVATQAATGYFGVTEDSIRRSNKLVLKFAQGAKPGLGGHILGAKVTSQVEDLRGVIAGISVFSPFPFHDVYSIEDVTKMLEWLRTINPDAIITVKISTPIDVYHVALGLVTGGADEIQIDATAGGTGAAPDIARNRIAMPLEYGLSDVHKFLVEQGERNKVTLVASGGIRSAYDMAKAIILGADKVVLGTQEVVAQQCNRCGNCEAPGGCQKGITTTVEQLEEQKEILLNAQWLINSQVSVVQHLMKMMYAWGVQDIRELRGRTDLISEWGWAGPKKRSAKAGNGRARSTRKGQQSGNGWNGSKEERKELDACGVVSFACTKSVPVESIQTACQRMHNRGNGRGGGILGLGGMFPAFRDCYALQVVVLGPEKQRKRKALKIAREHLADFELHRRGSNPVPISDLTLSSVDHCRNPRRQRDGQDISYQEAGLKADPGDIYRFFVRVKKEVLLQFAKEILETCRISEDDRNVLSNGNPTDFLQKVNIAGKWIDYYVKYFELLTDDYLATLDPGSEFWLQAEYESLWRDLEDEFVYRTSFALNEKHYIDPQNRSESPQAFVASMMKDGGIWKLVGFAEQAADYWLVGDAQYVAVSELGSFLEKTLKGHTEIASKLQSLVCRFQEGEKLEPTAVEGVQWRVLEGQVEVDLRSGKDQKIMLIVPKSGKQAVAILNYGAHMWIGHQRFPTVFSPYSGGSHPFYGRVHEALIHNGDFANYVAMVRFWDQFGGAPQFRTDTEMAAKAYSILKQMGYPQTHIFETIAPTTGIDMQRLKEIRPELAADFEAIQKSQIAGSPDGPWFFIIGDQDPVSRDLRMVGLTDTSVLRPSVFVWQHAGNGKHASIGLVGSEEQACRSVLDALFERGVLASREPDSVRIIRGGSVEQDKDGDVRGGGAIVYNLRKEGGGQYNFSISDKFGNAIQGETGHHYDFKNYLNCDSGEIQNLAGRVFNSKGGLEFKTAESIFSFVEENLKEWEFNTIRWLVGALGNYARTHGHLRLVTSALTDIRDRVQALDVGHGPNAKKRASVVQIISDELDTIFDHVPPIQTASKSGEFFRLVHASRDQIADCDDRDKVLVVDASGFEPEGHDSLARTLVLAYEKGWKKFVVYKTTGQRYLGVGFGPQSHDLELHLYGSPGQDIANSVMGGTVYVHADAQNDMCKIMHSGTVVVHGLAGNTGIYGAKGGEIYIRSSVGTRWVINSVSSPFGPGLKVVIVGSAMEYLAESLMGGMVLMLGLEWDATGVLRRKYLPFAGNSILAGASAGKVIIYDPDDRIVEKQFEGSVDVGFLSRDWIAVYKNLENLVENEFARDRWSHAVERWRAMARVSLQSDDWALPEKQDAVNVLMDLLKNISASKGDYNKLRANAEILRDIIEERFTGKEWRTLVRQLGQILIPVTWPDGIELLERLMDWKEVTELLIKSDEFFHLGLKIENGSLHLPIDGQATEIRREHFKVLRPLKPNERKQDVQVELIEDRVVTFGEEGLP